MPEPEREKEADAALDVASGDVVKAFDTYLAHHNTGRRILVAGHSQGGFHALRLPAERFSRRPLREKLVAASLVGIPIATDVFTRTFLFASLPHRRVALWSGIPSGRM